MADILIHVVEKDIEKLDILAKRYHSSRSAIIEEALEEWIDKHNLQPAEEAAFGILKKHAVDGLELQQKIRGEW